jgi:hypothetical protein
VSEQNKNKKRKVNMSETKHTPGPWQAADITDANLIPHRWVCGCGNDWAVITRKAGAVALQQESCANARLIAAAPELLEALEALVAADLPNSNREHCLKATDIARTAIAKAKGGDK